MCERERSTLSPFSTRAFFSPSSSKGKTAKPSSSIAGKKRPNSDTDDTKTADQSPENSTNKGPVTSASESPVFKSKSKRRRVIIDSDEEEEAGNGDVRNENGGGVRDGDGKEVGNEEDDRDEGMDTSTCDSVEKKIGASEEVSIEHESKV